MAENMTEMSAEQEQEARAADEIREESANKGTNRRMHPALVAWLAAKGNLFGETVRGDLANAPERHPDVRLLKRLLPQSSTPLHIRMAWLCWRARQVRFFHPDFGSRLHTGSDVMTWAEAIISADEREDIHDEAFVARANYYASRKPLSSMREASEAEEEAVALTLMRLPTTGRGPAVDLPVPSDTSHAEKERQMELARGKQEEEQPEGVKKAKK